MKLEDQVTSLDLSIKFKKIGIKQESLFYYSFHTINSLENSIEDYYLTFGKGYGINCSAFTASELLEILPDTIEDPNEDDQRINLTINYHILFSIEYGFHNKMNYIQDKNLCNALAKMLIHLIENKLMEIPK